MKTVDAVLNLLFPRKCIGCGDGADAEYGYAFCKKCGRNIEVEMSEICPVCHMAQTECRCRPTIGADGAVYMHLIPYDSELSKKAVFSLKRKNLTAPRKFFAKRMAELASEEGFSVVTFAPRSQSALREYGFDQSRMLAKEVARELRASLQTLFVHTKNGGEQKTLGLKERAENAGESYALRRDAKLCGETLIIVDDVITSGSTSSELCRLAKVAGAGKIVVLTAAKTPSKGKK